jgi:hypothetical protein
MVGVVEEAPGRFPAEVRLDRVHEFGRRCQPVQQCQLAGSQGEKLAPPRLTRFRRDERKRREELLAGSAVRGEQNGHRAGLEGYVLLLLPPFQPFRPSAVVVAAQCEDGKRFRRGNAVTVVCGKRAQEPRPRPQECAQRLNYVGSRDRHLCPLTYSSEKRLDGAGGAVVPARDAGQRDRRGGPGPKLPRLQRVRVEADVLPQEQGASRGQLGSDRSGLAGEWR